MELNNWIAASTGIVLLAAAIFAWKSYRQASKQATWEATNEIYKEWWGKKLRELRHYFYEVFLPKYKSELKGKLSGKGMKEIGELHPDIRKLCYFFDRVGWLGAANLIDVGYVMGPMQHSVRRLWLIMEKNITREREFSTTKLLDSVYLSGFEWLFKRSEKKPQAKLIRSKFNNPRLLSRAQYKKMQNEIDEDEKGFHKDYLGDN
ncbi:MAG: hypothetical protein ABR958_02100 [Dehalococcoidales bacterium]